MPAQAVEWRGKRYDAHAMTEEIVGCKWSLSVLGAVRDGFSRPSEMTRRCKGISIKVLNERLAKLQAFGILERVELSDKRQHVEYRLTERGATFARILDEIDALQQHIDGA
jgi:DNA-binding HxlR family transcriptional regulator